MPEIKRHWRRAAAWGWIVLALAAALSRLWRRRSREPEDSGAEADDAGPTGGFLGFGPDLVEPAVCFRCGRDGFRRFGKDGFDLVKCPECAQAFVTPRLTEEGRLELYGDSDYFDQGVYSSRWARRLQKTWIRGRLDLIDDALEGGGIPTIFEVGCAYGPFLAEARERGFGVGGLEYSPVAADKASEDLGVPIHVGELEHLDTGDDEYDAVAFWDVLEHVPDPAAFMRRAVSITRPGGVVALSGSLQSEPGAFVKAAGPVPVLLTLGSRDQLVTPKATRQAAAILESLGHRPEVFEFDGAHSMRYAMDKLRRFIKENARL